MYKSYKYRLYPNKQQNQLLDRTIGCCRMVYNLALETKIRAYKDCGVKLSAFDLCYQLADLKKDLPWLNEVDSQALQMSIKTVDKAFKNFFRGNGYPKFKSKRNGGSFTCPNNTRKVNFEQNTITVPKIPGIKAKLSRHFEGQLKTITISKTTTGKYYASVLVDDKKVLPQPITIAKNKTLGIDLGLTHYLITSEGQKQENPKYLKQALTRLKVLQTRASKKKKGSANRKKANLKVAKAHENVTNKRTDFLQKLTTKLVGDNQTETICVESLAVKNMVKNHNLAQAITDASWAEFVRQITYKAQWAGKNVIAINQWAPSSKICSNCGVLHDDLKLADRSWQCINCGVAHDRDINAAKNIKYMGLQQAGVLPRGLWSSRQKLGQRSRNVTKLIN